MIRKRSFVVVNITLIILLVFNINSIFSADEMALGRQAEQDGKFRQALQHYVVALQSTSEDSSADQLLREKIIKLAQKIQPPPTIPEAVLRHMGRGQAAVEIAKEPEDFNQAIDEFKKAVQLGP